jgi:hypothetical protein
VIASARTGASKLTFISHAEPLMMNAKRRVSTMDTRLFAFIMKVRLTCLILGSLAGCKLRPVEAIGRGGISEEVALVEHKF